MAESDDEKPSPPPKKPRWPITTWWEIALVIASIALTAFFLFFVLTPLAASAVAVTIIASMIALAAATIFTLFLTAYNYHDDQKIKSEKNSLPPTSGEIMALVMSVAFLSLTIFVMPSPFFTFFFLTLALGTFVTTVWSGYTKSEQSTKGDSKKNTTFTSTPKSAVQITSRISENPHPLSSNPAHPTGLTPAPVKEQKYTVSDLYGLLESGNNNHHHIFSIITRYGIYNNNREKVKLHYFLRFLYYHSREDKEPGPEILKFLDGLKQEISALKTPKDLEKTICGYKIPALLTELNSFNSTIGKTHKKVKQLTEEITVLLTEEGHGPSSNSHSAAPLAS